MKHLFNKVYLDVLDRYSSKNENAIYSLEGVEHPMAKPLDMPLDPIISFSEHLKQTFDSDVELFWEKHISLGVNHKYILFCDSKLYVVLCIQFWKSIFKNTSIDFIYYLYCTDYQDQKLKFMMGVDTRQSSFLAELLSKDEIKRIYDEQPIIQVLQRLPKSTVSFEYLMAESFSEFRDELSFSVFVNKLNEMAWKTWISDLKSIRNEFLANVLFLEEHFNFGSIDIQNPNGLKEAVSKNELTKWLSDASLFNSGKDYITKNYNADYFVNVYQVYNKMIGLPTEQLSDVASISNFIFYTKKIFSSGYMDLLEANLKSNNGCLFIQDHLRLEANHILASEIFKAIDLKNNKYLNQFNLT